MNVSVSFPLTFDLLIFPLPSFKYSHFISSLSTFNWPLIKSSYVFNAQKNILLAYRPHWDCPSWRCWRQSYGIVFVFFTLCPVFLCFHRSSYPLFLPSTLLCGPWLCLLPGCPLSLSQSLALVNLTALTPPLYSSCSHLTSPFPCNLSCHPSNPWPCDPYPKLAGSALPTLSK